MGFFVVVVFRWVGVLFLSIWCSDIALLFFVVFFFQAEDGIRDSDM